ncbi:MAG TPA: HRDC domain-containing protein [Longimicrobiales bacterium]|nr:HRDC domain-containing protein [Longimicrobiales bacterium]
MRYITTDDELRGVAAELEESGLVAVDTEAAGYHRYLDRVCLVQLTSEAGTWVVDALTVSGLEPLRDVLGTHQVEVVFHDADYDLRLLHRDYGMSVAGLFDTKIAAQFLGESAFGLQNLLEKELGISLEKKYQRADWAKRPLPPEMLDYAAEDTRYLPELRDRLRDGLRAAGRLEWAEEEFRLVEATRWEEPGDTRDAYLSLKGARDLDGRQRAALQELYAWREAEGKRRDVATFRVLSKEALVETARQLPRNTRQLSGVPGIGSRLAASVGDDLLAAVERALLLPDAELPAPLARPPRRPRPDPELEERVERLKKARDRAADRLELDRGFLMARWQLAEVAAAEPRTLEELGGLGSVRRWQLEALGRELLEAL